MSEQCPNENDGRLCSRTKGHTHPCRFRGLKRSAQIARAREVLESEAGLIAFEVSPQVMGALDQLRDSGLFGGPNATVSSVAEELLRTALLQHGDFIK